MLILTIIWLILNIALSLPVCLFIVNFISKKSPITLTLVDLIYRDVVVYMFAICLTFSIGIIRCCIAATADNEEDNIGTLAYNESTFYGVTIMTLIGCVTLSTIVSGGLRLISILRLI